jgi:Resolvase, N terminal domain
MQDGLIDVVVVCKVDRLTRSLADFAKMVEVFDAQGVSFVAVTQQFNTTTSMGRLTLNVLLSFAQRFWTESSGRRSKSVCEIAPIVRPSLEPKCHRVRSLERSSTKLVSRCTSKPPRKTGSGIGTTYQKRAGAIVSAPARSYTSRRSQISRPRARALSIATSPLSLEPIVDGKRFLDLIEHLNPE